MSFLTLLVGCFSGRPGIEIINLENGQKKFLSSGFLSQFRGTICYVNYKNNYFQTLKRDKDQLDLKTLNFNGEELSIKKIPLFTRFYGNENEYTFSPDGQKIVYYKDKDKGLCLYDIKTKVDIPLITNISNTSVSIYKMHFISDKDLILLLSADEDIGRDNCQIVKFNIDTKKSTLLYEPIYLESFSNAFSPSNKLLAFFDGFKRHASYGVIKILDLKTAKIVDTIADPKSKPLYRIYWSPNSNKLGYTLGDDIRVYSLNNRKAKTTITTSKDKLFRLYGFVNDHTLLFAETKDFNAPIKKKLQTVNINTHEIKTICTVRKNGSLYIVDNGKKALVEVGY